MEYGVMSAGRIPSERRLGWGIRFFLSAALTASQTAGGYAPFALGCVAAAGAGADGAAALLGGAAEPPPCWEARRGRCCFWNFPGRWPSRRRES